MVLSVLSGALYPLAFAHALIALCATGGSTACFLLSQHLGQGVGRFLGVDGKLAWLRAQVAQAVEDGSTVRIYYESRLARVELTEEGQKLVEELDDELAGEELSDAQKAKAKWTQLEALVGSESRMRNVAQDIVQHFEARQEVFEGKAMIVTMSRRIAAELYAEIVQIRPD